MGSIEEALKAAGAENDLQTILRVLEDESVGFKRQEAAAAPFANMDIAMLTGLNIRMLSVITRAQQQQQQRYQHRFPSHQLSNVGSLCSAGITLAMWSCTLHLAYEQSCPRAVSLVCGLIVLLLGHSEFGCIVAGHDQCSCLAVFVA